MIPLWVIFGVASLFIGCAMPLIQEKRQANGFALAFWNKLFTTLLMIPFVVYYGLPSDPRFYGIAFVTALLWCGADIVYFRTIAIVGAGVVTRLVPSAVILTFLLWFAVDPSLLHKYAQHPAQGILIALIIALTATFAMRVKKCPVSWGAVGMLLPLLFAATVGPVLQKLGLAQAPVHQAPYAFTLIQGAMMTVILAVSYAIRKPVDRATFLSRHSLITGGLVSLSSGFGNVVRNFAFIFVENPAYLSVLLLADSLLIHAYHRLIGKKDESDVLAGLGIVACAMALIFVKSLW